MSAHAALAAASLVSEVDGNHGQLRVGTHDLPGVVPPTPLRGL